METIIKIIDEEIRKYTLDRYEGVTYNIGFVDGLNFVRNLLIDYGNTILTRNEDNP